MIKTELTQSHSIVGFFGHFRSGIASTARSYSEESLDRKSNYWRGVVCGLISGLIEYEVFAELYKKVTATNLPFFSIPLLIVFSLEVTKIFLVFLDKQASLTNNEGYISDRTIFNRIRILLISTSCICTLIFSFYSLHNPEYEKRLTERKQELKSHHTQQLAQIDTEFNQRMAGIDTEVEMWRQRLDIEAQRVINGVSEGPRYKAYEKRYSQAVENRDKLRGQHEESRLQQITELNQTHEQKLKSAAESLTKFSSRPVYCSERNRYLATLIEEFTTISCRILDRVMARFSTRNINQGRGIVYGTFC